jgi:hypothetical protein
MGLPLGTKPRFISKQLGHANAQMYSKWIEVEADKHESDKYDAVSIKSLGQTWDKRDKLLRIV